GLRAHQDGEVPEPRSHFVPLECPTSPMRHAFHGWRDIQVHRQKTDGTQTIAINNELPVLSPGSVPHVQGRNFRACNIRSRPKAFASRCTEFQRPRIYLADSIASRSAVPSLHVDRKNV